VRCSGRPGQRRRVGWVRSRAWICDFSSTHSTAALGWVQVQADDVVDLGGQLRVGEELEGLGAPGLDAVLTPDAGHGVAADAELAGQQPG
jgi:hypothetical protein